jgi:hypothetical protein
MSIQGKAIGGVLMIAAVIGAAWYLKGLLSGLIPGVVKEGAEAAAVLAWEGAQIVAHPLDGFGIAPGTWADGTPKWEKSVPWNAQDATNNNDAGINFNYF